MKESLTIRELVVRLLEQREDPTPMTASEMYHRLHKLYKVKLSSLSSVLHKMTEAGELRRIKDFGPRGGYGYGLKRKTK